MTKFTDGPAAGVVLSLHRAPLYLRVVRDTDGKVDALDQLDDRPEIDEEVFAYALTENRGIVHINARDNRGRRCGGFFPMTTYQLAITQPTDKTMRDSKAWGEWALGQDKAKREAGGASSASEEES
jgi:hypothetical protein